MEFVDQAFKIWILLSVSGHEEEEDGVGGGHYYTPHWRSHHTEVREIWWDQTEFQSFILSTAIHWNQVSELFDFNFRDLPEPSHKGISGLSCGYDGNKVELSQDAVYI